MERNFEQNPEASKVLNFRSEKPKINTERPESRKDVAERLIKLLAEISENINRELSKKYGIKDLVDSECKMSTRGFSYEEGGIYDKSVIEESDKEVYEYELEFSSADNEKVQAFYKDKYYRDRDAISEKDVIAVWKKNKSKEKNVQTEIIITALLNKILGDRYLIVRATDYDDYKNGVDNIILDKETGAVICGFDDVHKVGDRLATKEDKITKTIRKGGAEVRFGVSLNKGVITRTELKNLPVFYLGLSDEELNKLVDGMSDNSQSVSDVEIEIFSILAKSIRQQCNTLEHFFKNNYTHIAVHENFDRFKASLKTLTNIEAQLTATKAA